VPPAQQHRLSKRLERGRKLRMTMRFDQRRCDLKAAESLNLVLR
jgi:hypothetical protein